MLGAIRRWFREESLGITIPVGVVLGFILEQLIAQVVYGFELEHLSNSQGRGFEISPLGISFYYPTVLMYAIAFAVVAAVAYLLFLLPLASDDEDEPETRECPECKSDIFADATRCAICTSVVTPLETSA